MNDPSQSETLRQNSETLRELSTGPISSSISKLSGSSRVFPSEKDFHFYYNFDEFRSPIDEIASKSLSMLQEIGSSRHLWGGREMSFPEDIDDDAYDWLVNVNDEVMDRFDSSVDGYTRLRKAQEEVARTGAVVDEDGFQLVCGRKKRGNGIGSGRREKEESAGLTAAVRVAEKDKKTVGGKPKVPFHIPTIKRPQDEYHILVNNANEPFQHVWLERSDDGSRVVHPLEKLSILDFVDRNVESIEPEKPLPMESTPFKQVGEVKDLKELASKLRNVNEFAVDLEHNQYRTFQGLTCLMQISTRTEDFVIDTLRLRIHIGPYLREIFRDPTKRKVMHGADKDIAWLQRDFGIYVCNLFDTGQASRVLQMERNSLEHLLQHFCGVTANKEYQNADWRLRPLPEEMIRYAREDTHYLLYIYDLMKIRLLSESTDPDNSDTLLLEVYKRSYDICLQLYEKELLTETSYLYIYGVQGANLNAQQLSVVAGLCEWRDAVARAADESTGFILPNKTLLEIAKQMPLTTSKLRSLVRSKHPYVERNLSSVVNIITHSVENASSFEAVAEQLKEGRIQAPELNDTGADSPEVHATGYFNREGADGSQHEQNCKPTCHDLDLPKNRDGPSFEDTGKNDHMRKGINGSTICESGKERLSPPAKKNEISACGVRAEKVAEATVQVLKKPNRAFGALLGSSASKKKTDLKKEKGDNKLEQIKSSVNLPFYPFLHRDLHSNQASEQASEESKRVSDTSVYGDQLMEPALVTTLPEDRVTAPTSSSKSDDVILLDSDSHDDAPQVNTTQHQEASNKPELMVQYEGDDDDDCDVDDDHEPMSLAELSSNFQKCLQSVNQNQTTKQDGKSKEAGCWQFKPFDYDVAREEVKFGEAAAREARRGNTAGKNMGKKKGGGAATADKSNQDESGLPQGRRRQAFPASGNRSTTFR